MRIKPTPPLKVATNSRPASYWSRLPRYRRRTVVIPVLNAPGEALSEVSVWTTLENWERMPESDEPGWDVCTIGPYVSARRLVLD